MDAWLLMTDRLRRAGIHPFRLAGALGLVAAGAVALAAPGAGHGLLPLAACAVASLGSSVLLVWLTRWRTGATELVYHRQHLVALASSAAVLWALGVPVMAYLDVVNLAMGAFLAVGRLGCLSVGCCHGRPASSSWGIRYRSLEAREGFMPGYVGARLVPVPLIEAAGVTVVVALGMVLRWQGSAPGAASVWYFTAYATGRFALELARGDCARPFFAGFSEAQWCSVAALAVLAALAAAGLVVAPVNPAWPFLAVTTSLLVIAVRRRRRDRRGEVVLLPPAVGALARALIGRSHESIGQAIQVIELPEGLRVSWSRVGGATCYTFSRRGRPLSEAGARRLAALVLSLRHRGAGSSQVRAGRAGVHHLVLADRGPVSDATAALTQPTWDQMIPPAPPPAS
jgi:hypothetical protein